MKQTFDIDKIENLLSDQKDVKGVLGLLDDIFLKIEKPLNGYDDFGIIPSKAVTEVAFEVQRNHDAVSALIRFLQDMNQKASKTINDEVSNYYQDARTNSNEVD